MRFYMARKETSHNTGTSSHPEILPYYEYTQQLKMIITKKQYQSGKCWSQTLSSRKLDWLTFLVQTASTSQMCRKQTDDSSGSICAQLRRIWRFPSTSTFKYWIKTSTTMLTAKYSSATLSQRWVNITYSLLQFNNYILYYTVYCVKASFMLK